MKTKVDSTSSYAGSYPVPCNASDQLTRWPSQHRYEYDGRGNVIYEKSDSGTLQKTYAYTYSNLTSSITYSGVSKSSVMTWDAAGNRISFQSSTRANDSDIYTFVYDVTAGIPAVIEETTPTGTNRYIREPGGELIARVSTVGSTETTQYYHFDEHGSTQFLTSVDGVITDKYTYDAWGNLTSHTGSTQQPYQYVGNYGYYTHTQDPNIKMMQLGVRLYDAETGRFVQRDSLPRTASNVYAYADVAPTKLTDPSGRMPWALIVGAVVVADVYRGARCCLNALNEEQSRRLTDKRMNGDKESHCIVACKCAKCVRPMCSRNSMLDARDLLSLIYTIIADFNNHSPSEGLSFWEHSFYNHMGHTFGALGMSCEYWCKMSWIAINGPGYKGTSTP